MKIRYYSDTDTLYLQLGEQTGADVIVVNDNMVVDIDENDQPVGVEIQQASRLTDVNSFEMAPIGQG